MKFLNNKKILLLTIFLTACTTFNHTTSKGFVYPNFSELLHENGNSVWSQHLNSKTKHARTNYDNKIILPNGQEYGHSVRNYDLRNKKFSDINQDMKQLGCKVREDAVKNPATKEYLVDSEGQRILMIVYLCLDGGVVRLKPNGDPTSKFRPQPHGSKSIRYPFDSPFESFDDEALKVDNEGYAIPKWMKDLNQNLIYENPELIEQWANDAHTDL